MALSSQRSSSPASWGVDFCIPCVRGVSSSQTRMLLFRSAVTSGLSVLYGTFPELSVFNTLSPLFVFSCVVSLTGMCLITKSYFFLSDLHMSRFLLFSYNLCYLKSPSLCYTSASPLQRYVCAPPSCLSVFISTYLPSSFFNVFIFVTLKVLCHRSPSSISFYVLHFHIGVIYLFIALSILLLELSFWKVN